MLQPESGIDVLDGRFEALCDEPWLALSHPHFSTWLGCLVEFTYRVSLLDEPARPIFRFWRRNGSHVDRFAAAPISGAGIWIGRIPDGTVRVSVSPTNQLGPFDFRIERIRQRSWLAMLMRGFRTCPRAARSAVLTRLIGWKAESDVNLAWAASSTPFVDYAAWHTVRARNFDPKDLDRPRFDWSNLRSIHIIVIGAESDGIHRTVEGLIAQTFPYWRALISETVDGFGAAPRDERVKRAGMAEVFNTLRTDTADILTCILRAGDVLMPHALAYVAEQSVRWPQVRAFFGDALDVSDGARALPCFRPGSLRLANSNGTPPIFIRNLGACSDGSLTQLLESRGGVGDLLDLKPGEGRLLRRVLVETGHAKGMVETPSQDAMRPVPSNATVAIILLTRDQPARLRRVVASIRARSRLGGYQLIIVDNGSKAVEASALIEELDRSSDTSRIDHPGPFDFSLMCNRAAATADADVLVFLNDDTEVLSDDWLDRLRFHALQPTVGAVGAKLTYPDGRLQHIGVVVGLGESAGHFGTLSLANPTAWADRNRNVHEVSAVTGACLAVERRKFEAVGGFDAEYLPIELSDIDLCLRMNAQGWQTLVDPAVHLMHEESASRGGATFRRLDVYADQRAVFVARWRHVVRDDPFFHPGLSLYSLKPALG